MDESPRPTTSDIENLFSQLEEKEGDTGNQDVIKKLQAIRLWQLMQQEELKQQQQSQLAILKSQVIESSFADEDSNEDRCPDEEDLDSDVDEVEDILAVPINYDSPVNIGNENIQLISPAGNICEIVNSGESDDVAMTHAFDENVEKSFENNSTSQVVFDDIPLNSQARTFEEILEKKLKQNVQNKMENSSQNISSTPKVAKKTFLRRGQGIARFNGPPPKPKVRTKKPKQQPIQDAPVRRKSPAIEMFEPKKSVPESPTNVIIATSGVNHFNAVNVNSPLAPQSGKQPERQIVRKTSRITRKEPIKELRLKPIVDSPLISRENSFQNCEDPTPEIGMHDSVWSDVEDSVILDAEDTLPAISDFNKTSNETFEQIEKYCNENYGHGTDIQSLENDTISCPDSTVTTKAPLPNMLMQKLFPSLNSASEVVPVTPPVCATSNTRTCSYEDKIVLPTDENAQSALLKKKLEELETEIRKFQNETSKLSSLREKETKQLKEMKKEIEIADQQHKKQSEEFDEFRKSEMKKLKKERKMLDEHVAALKDLPSKQCREQIAELEQEMTTLREEMKVKEQRLGAVNSRLRSQLEVAVKENKTLTDKMKSLEATVVRFEKQNSLRKNKRANTMWKAINDIVDSVPLLDQSDQENYNPRDVHLSVKKQSVSQNMSATGEVLKEIVTDSNDNVLVEKGNKSFSSDGKKVERRLQDGTQEITFQNGTQKIISPDDNSVQIKFTNGDIKTTYPDGKVTYFYTASGTKHTTHSNGMQIIEFSNNQLERHFPDGSKHISFDDGSSKMIKPNGTEETTFPDGTVMTVKDNGEKWVEYPSGQKEIHTPVFKRRTYPDGTSKTVYADGRQETRYASGRFRVKDADGTVVVDTISS